ncbi:response regulator transcription factor [Fundicoccus ignavus]|uniref:Response regulator n=1 Tax=Fundicoccus ignavus TaxID=2664442 RepID=A0A844C2C6_9LACT|nr:response regulator transcription factor [Fundicoccus ignavus]MRJ48538.1 response regulator [Fundicoccus ignavus]
MFKLMIVEDDCIIQQALQTELEKWDYHVHCVTSFHDVMADFLEFEPQLVLLDVNLPAFNGYHWCQEIRKLSQIPIIFVTSRDETMDLVMAIQLGGDDYIQKPFQLSIVTAKVQALLRRTYDFNEPLQFMSVGQVVLRANESRLTVGEEAVDLTRNELRIIEILFQHKGTFVTREAIMMHLWEDESFIDDNTLAVNITRLRKKFTEIGQTNMIKTKKGVGYGVGID